MEGTLIENEKVTIEQLKDATHYLNDTKSLEFQIFETPLVSINGCNLNLPTNLNVYLKLENMQNTGSFKIRGVLNQFRNISTKNDTKIVTFSGGNYGKTFAYLASKNKLKAKVIMPESVSEAKFNYIKSQGIETQKVVHTDLMKTVEEHVNKGYKLVHPIDDNHLICGYSSIAFEILKQTTQPPDILLVCCGGGALLAGISCVFGLLNLKTLIYGVEPQTANSMYQSFQVGYPIKMPSSYSAATGLSPPFAGRLAYYNCRRYVKDILLVSDNEIKEACKKLFEIGIKAELSGCAAFAALLFNKLNILNEDKLSIVTLISGGNISAEEIFNLNKLD